MLGWEVLVFRGDVPAADATSATVARWRTSVSGLRWLDVLVSRGLAFKIDQGGYPDRYSVPADAFLAAVTNGLPANSSPLVIGDDYVVPEGWNGELDIDREALARCPDDEMLQIEAWDMS